MIEIGTKIEHLKVNLETKTKDIKHMNAICFIENSANLSGIIEVKNKEESLITKEIDNLEIEQKQIKEELKL